MQNEDLWIEENIVKLSILLYFREHGYNTLVTDTFSLIGVKVWDIFSVIGDISMRFSL